MEFDTMRIASKLSVLALFAALTMFATPGQAQLGFLVINEVDTDTPTLPINDDKEYVELWDGGIGNQSLVGYCLVFYNGNGDTAYFAMDLTGSTDGAGYYLVGNVGVVPAPAQTWVTNFLQNGPDAVALYFDSAANFPNGSAINVGATLQDAVVTETSDGPDPGLLVLTPGQPQVDENANGLSANESVFRCPDGAGGQFITTSWIAGPPTPGAPTLCAPLYSINITQPGGCGNPIIFAVLNAAPNAEIYNLLAVQCVVPGSGPLFGLASGPGSGDPLSQLFFPLGTFPFHINADPAGNVVVGIPMPAVPCTITFPLQAVSITVSGFSVTAVSQPMSCSQLSLP
jgi:hypothetical protein